MKNHFMLLFILLISFTSKASRKDSTIYYNLPDSVKASVFMAELKITSVTAKYFSVGITTTAGILRFSEYKGVRRISFETDKFSPTMAVGNGINAQRNIKGSFFDFKYNWQLNKTYKLMIAVATDSAANFHVGSAYVFLPDENKWKFLGTSRHYGNTTLKNPHIRFHTHKKGSSQVSIGDVWCQRNNGSWKNMKDQPLPNPTVNLYGHIDSIEQRKTDIKIIEDAIASGKTDVKENIESVYYKIMKEGTGRLVSVNDTVVAYYKGYLFANDSIFDQTKDKPATFPLKRLIRGWQIGVPLCRVGGKIKIVIPSDLAYSVRTRAAKIPPNSILVFEIEVLEAKSPL